ncbi:MAG: hemolysin family protein [Chloroflexi bacterium]|nr:hemolysin family protein [Chloroflexota bacterium]
MLITIATMFIVVALMIGCNALYVAGEFAAVSARRPRIIQAAVEGNRFAQALRPIIENSHRLDNYIAASQVGITLSSVVLGIYGQQQIAPLIEPVFGELPIISEGAAAAGMAATLVLIFLTTLQVILGELVPKSLALRYPERVAFATVLPMRWSAEWILRPLIVLLNGSGTFLLRLFGATHEGGHKHVHSPEEIKFLIEQSVEGGVLDPEEHRLLDNVFRLSEMKIGEIVVPRTRMVTASVDLPLDEVLKIVAESDFTRVPIHENDIDHIIGFVHLKDVFQHSVAKDIQSVRECLREVTYVPETTPVDEVWATLNREEHYLAIVFDEYGGTLGMVTREDLIEELFGEVQDEFDTDTTPQIKQIDKQEFLIRGDAPISLLNDRFDIELPTDKAYTIGGLLPNLMEKIPRQGEEITVDSIRLIAQTVEDRAVEEVKLILPKKSDVTEEELD